MAMACLLVLGDGESLAAMRVPKSPRTGYDPVSEEEREASSAFARRVAEALDLLDKARKAQARDDFEAAFRYYSLVLPLWFFTSFSNSLISPFCIQTSIE